MKTLTVDLAHGRSYPIWIGAGLRADAARWLRDRLPAQRVVVVSNEVVAPLYLHDLLQVLREDGIAASEFVLPDGEAHKTRQTLASIHDALLEMRCERNTTLIALGGGVVGDIAGFAAATYQRGMPFIQMPTTLLAQVDSSVGGKTGINHPLGKNMIGAFYQPQAVLIDLEVLNTLPDRELRAGLAEVLKYGLIRDADFWCWLEGNLEALLQRDPQALQYAIQRCCENKAAVVAADEREAGERALLNLGHTFGHAIEAELGYGNWLHGEAVAAGCVMAAHLSTRLGWLTEAAASRIETLFCRAGLPVRIPPAASARYLQWMQGDKKVSDGRLRMILLRDIGAAVISEQASGVQIMATIEACFDNTPPA